MCGHATDQSPIDIIEADVAEDHSLGNILFNMPEQSVNISFLYDLKTWQANTPRGAAGVTFRGKEFRLIQFHFHSPSENTINGVHGAMESHFVNVASDGQILVVANIWDLGEESLLLSHLQQLAAPYIGDPSNFTVGGVTIPNPYHWTGGVDQSYYHYTGSLTTPPCTNGTEWVVMNHRASLSPEQLTAFRHDLSDPACTMLAEHDSEYPEGIPHSDWDPTLGVNNRPTQPLAGRAVHFHTFSEAERPQQPGSPARQPRQPLASLAATPLAGATAGELGDALAARQPGAAERFGQILAALLCLSLVAAAAGMALLRGRARGQKDERLLQPQAEADCGAFPSTA